MKIREIEPELQNDAVWLNYNRDYQETEALGRTEQIPFSRQPPMFYFH